MIEFHVEKAPAVSWEDVIKGRIQRGRLVGFLNTREVQARIFHDEVDDRFALQVAVTLLKQTRQFDCTLTRQRGGVSLVFTQLNHGGAPVPVGHGHLKGDRFFAKLNFGGGFFFLVDPGAAYFLPLGKPLTAGSTPLSRQRPDAGDDDGDDADALSAADLRRLRGEVAIHERKRS